MGFQVVDPEEGLLPPKAKALAKESPASKPPRRRPAGRRHQPDLLQTAPASRRGSTGYI